MSALLRMTNFQVRRFKDTRFFVHTLVVSTMQLVALQALAAHAVPAGASVTVKLYNDETYIPHDVRVDVPGAEASKLCVGPCVSTLTFTAPDPGTHAFYCTLHPDMKGSVFVQ